MHFSAKVMFTAIDLRYNLKDSVSYSSAAHHHTWTNTFDENVKAKVGWD